MFQIQANLFTHIFCLKFLSSEHVWKKISKIRGILHYHMDIHWDICPTYCRWVRYLLVSATFSIVAITALIVNFRFLFRWWQVPYFWVGIKLYDIVAGRQLLKSSYYVGKKKTLEMFPMLSSENLCGSIIYYDGTL